MFPSIVDMKNANFFSDSNISVPLNLQVDNWCISIKKTSFSHSADCNMTVFSEFLTFCSPGSWNNKIRETREILAILHESCQKNCTEFVKGFRMFSGGIEVEDERKWVKNEHFINWLPVNMSSEHCGNFIHWNVQAKTKWS